MPLPGKLFVSQPALSATIKKCETLLGGQLFENDPSGFINQGRTGFILKHCSTIAICRLNQHVKEVFAKEQGMLHIGIPSFAQGGLAKHLKV